MGRDINITIKTGNIIICPSKKRKGCKPHEILDNLNKGNYGGDFYYAS